MKRSSYYWVKYFLRPLKTTFIGRSYLFYLGLTTFLFLHGLILYGAYFLSDLVYDAEMEEILSKVSLIFLIYLPGALLLFVFAVFIRIITDKVRKKPGTILRFRIVSAFFIVTVIPALFYMLFIDEILTQTLDVYYEKESVQAMQLTVHDLEMQVDQLKLNLKRDLTKKDFQEWQESWLDGSLEEVELKQFIFEINVSLAAVVHQGRVFNVVGDITKNIREILLVNSRDIHFEKTKVEFDLENNVLVAVLKQEQVDGVLVFLRKISPTFSKRIHNNMNMVKRVTEFYLLRDHIKNILLTIYIYFYIPIISFGLLFFYLQSYFLSSPIGKLNEATKMVSQDDFSFRLEAKGNDEISNLIQSFKFMTKELLYNREKLRKVSQVEAWKDVAVRIAHELKNPLTPIVLATDRIESVLLKKDFELYSELLPSFHLIQTEIESIRHLVKEFSNYSKALDVNKEWVSVDDWSKPIASQLEHYEGIDTTLERDYPDDFLVYMDERSVKQVVDNLIQNALENFEAKDKEPKIRVNIHKIKINKEQYLKVEVGGNGKTIPQDLQDRVFDPYFTTKQSGTGLGLAICERIISRHQGDISFESQGEWTKFWFTIPVDARDLS